MAEQSPGKRRRRPRVAALLLMVVLSLVVLATCAMPPSLPAGVTKTRARISCDGVMVAVDFYHPAREEAAAIAVVAHGFLRGRRHMAGWGADLARLGITAAVLDQPRWANHRANARTIAELARQGRQGLWPVAARPGAPLALMGFSMGGLTTLLAAAELSPPPEAWVGLDPVDHSGWGARAAAEVWSPALALLAEPAPFNRHGNALSMLRDYAGPLRLLRVPGATHSDPEHPTDLAGQLACGRAHPERQRLFRETAAAFLTRALLEKKPAAFAPADGLVELHPRGGAQGKF